MIRKPLFGLSLALSILVVTTVACSSPAAPAPTSAPAPKAAEPTKPAAAQPTSAPAAPAAQPTTAAAPAGAIQKPAGWPTRPIQLIVPWDAGGSTDVGMRLLAPKMEKILGTTIDVVNRPGAGSQVGVTELAKAKPDGYTIGNVSAPAVQTIYLDPDRKAQFTWESFEPVGLQVLDPGVIAVGVDSKYKSLKDLIEDAKANPGKVKVSTTGVMGDDHMAILLLQKMTGVNWSIVHFTGGAPQLTALLGGHVDVGFDNVGTYAKTDKEGKTRTLAVMDKQRSKFQPTVPTAEEQGYKIYSSSSRGVAAPKGTPKEIVTALSQAMEQAMKDPDMVQKMEASNLSLKYMNGEEFGKYWKEFEEQVKPLMQAARETS